MDRGAVVVVSRRDIFGEPPPGEGPDTPAAAPAQWDFEEVDVGTGPAAALPGSDEPAPAASVLDFQLFGGDGVAAVDLAARPQEIVQSRPRAYYFFEPSAAARASFAAAALSGEQVLGEAHFWRARAAQNGLAPDVNAHYLPPRRRCRPGKAARANKRALKTRREADERDRREQWQRQRRAQRGPPRRRP